MTSLRIKYDNGSWGTDLGIDRIERLTPDDVSEVIRTLDVIMQDLRRIREWMR